MKTQTWSDHMSNIVYLEPNRINAVPFTTSDVIATGADVQHHAIQQLITKHRADFEDFGLLAFEMRKPQPGSKGGRSQTIYHLNEQQATLLMTYLQNTPIVRAFKKELVRQFYAMREELANRRVERAALNPVRREMTDAIMESGADKWSYKHFTDLAYKQSVGMTAKQLREARNADSKDKAIDYMTADEIAAVAKRQYQIAVLIDLGYSYAMVKQILATGKKLTTDQTA